MTQGFHVQLRIKIGGIEPPMPEHVGNWLHIHSTMVQS
jgi:hypothetical protein